MEEYRWLVYRPSSGCQTNKIKNIYILYNFIKLLFSLLYLVLDCLDFFGGHFQPHFSKF